MGSRVGGPVRLLGAHWLPCWRRPRLPRPPRRISETWLRFLPVLLCTPRGLSCCSWGGRSLELNFIYEGLWSSFLHIAWSSSFVATWAACFPQVRRVLAILFAYTLPASARSSRSARSPSLCLRAVVWTFLSLLFKLMMSSCPLFFTSDVFSLQVQFGSFLFFLDLYSVHSVFPHLFEQKCCRFFFFF